ncbi:hypothetical protein, partial [Ciceribacter ferrooxidans]|uniref:hypothetical protein n=1 Tax=Ciceribacter ferrooxidans TaxID=2509717 RepID=UPI00196AEA7D
MVEQFPVQASTDDVVKQKDKARKSHTLQVNDVTTAKSPTQNATESSSFMVLQFTGSSDALRYCSSV